MPRTALNCWRLHLQEATEGKNRMQGSAFYSPGQGYSQASEAATRRGYVVGDNGRIM